MLENEIRAKFGQLSRSIFTNREHNTTLTIYQITREKIYTAKLEKNISNRWLS